MFASVGITYQLDSSVLSPAASSHWDQRPWFEFASSHLTMNNNKRTREEGAGSENTFVWEPFQKRASSPEMSRKRVSDFSDFARSLNDSDFPT